MTKTITYCISSELQVLQLQLLHLFHLQHLDWVQFLITLLIIQSMYPIVLVMMHC